MRQPAGEVMLTDAGATWLEGWPLVQDRLLGVHFHSATNGLAVGDGGTILRTTSGCQ